MKNFDLHSPELNKRSLGYVKECIKTGWLSPSGKYVKLFEKRIESYTSSKCITCNSGTAALHLSLILKNIMSNDEVIVPTITYIATVNSVLYNNARPIFIDCNDDLSIDVDKLKDFLKSNTILRNGSCINKKTKKKIKALIVTHVLGNIAKFEDLKKTCKKYNIIIIEDAAEAIGSFYKKSLHAGTLGDVGILSFNVNKVITSAGGGALLVKKETDKIKLNHLANQSKKDKVFFKHYGIGYNYGLSNIGAAIGLSQIEKIKNILKKKKIIFKTYKEYFKNIDNIKLFKPNKLCDSNHWLNAIIVEKVRYSNFKKIINNLNNSGIQVRPLWYPCHLQHHLKKFQRHKITKANEIYKKLICLPSSHFLKKDEIKKISKLVINEIKKYKN